MTELHRSKAQENDREQSFGENPEIQAERLGTTRSGKKGINPSYKYIQGI